MTLCHNMQFFMTFFLLRPVRMWCFATFREVGDHVGQSLAALLHWHFVQLFITEAAALPSTNVLRTSDK